jgi:intracellular multiplication protein IcmO
MAIRGLEEKHEHGAQQIARDTRPLGTRAAEFISQPEASTSFQISGIVAIVLYPEFTDLFFLILFGLFMFVTFCTDKTLPFRMPRSSDQLDYNDIKPGSTKPNKADGISFLGNDRVTQRELWFTNSDLRTHILIFGSTGSGKTEALVSIAFNSLVQASGFIYVDGKGDNSLFAKIFSMVRGMGREDDVLLINFMTGARDVLGPQTNRLSNTMNPFSHGSSSMLSQLVTSLMDSGSSGDSSGDMWKGRAINFVESLMKILTAMRDAGHILLDANTIRDYFILEKLESIVVDKQFPIGDDNFKVSISDFPPSILEPLKNYILNLPGYNPKNKFNQAGEVREQHGFITMQLTRVFGSLADTYGHIIRTNLAEVDLKDVVLNRRILVVLLPALEKSPDELANLGKVIIASLKAMMAAGLGDAVEGDYRDVVLSKPTNSPSPYVCIMDEYGYYAVKGFAVVPAQARSLGFSAIFAGQDLPAFQKASKEEAASIGANCNIKICMKLEDPMETWDFFNKTAGETYVTNVSGFQMDAGSVSLNYMDTKNASIDRKQRIELLDLKDQREGESHIFFKSKIIRAEMFYANPKPVKQLKVNHLLKVEIPSTKELISLEQRIKLFKAVFVDNKFSEPQVTSNEDINILRQALADVEADNPLDRGIAGIIAVLENEVEKQKKLNAEYEVKKTPEPATKSTNAATSAADNSQIIEEETYAMLSNTSIFTGVPMTKLVKSIIDQEDVELFQLPLLRRGYVTDSIKNLEQLAGFSQQDASTNANQVVKDLIDVTTFPNQVPPDTDLTEYLQDLKTLIKMLGGDANIEPVVTPPPTSLPDLPDLGSDSPEGMNLPLSAKLPDLPDLDDFDDLDDLDDLDDWDD